jgi:hypothetical protein
VHLAVLVFEHVVLRVGHAHELRRVLFFLNLPLLARFASKGPRLGDIATGRDRQAQQQPSNIVSLHQTESPSGQRSSAVKVHSPIAAADEAGGSLEVSSTGQRPSDKREVGF